LPKSLLMAGSFALTKSLARAENARTYLSPGPLCLCSEFIEMHP